MNYLKHNLLFFLICLLIGSNLHAESSSRVDYMLNKQSVSSSVSFRITIKTRLGIHSSQNATQLHSNTGLLLISRHHQPTLLNSQGYIDIRHNELQHTTWTAASP